MLREGAVCFPSIHGISCHVECVLILARRDIVMFVIRYEMGRKNINY